MSGITDWRHLHGRAFEGKRALVTGGAGFIGSHLAEALALLGVKVVVVDDLSGSAGDFLDHIDPEAARSIRFIEGTILDRPMLAEAAKGCDFVFHQAALGSVPRSVEMPDKYVQVNIVGTQNVLEAARANSVKRVMFAASSSAYGNTRRLPKPESMAPHPLSPYAATKAAGEALMCAYAHSFGLDAVSLRYFNIFGPRQSPDNAYAAVIAAFAKAMIHGERPVIFGDGEQSRDFTFVDNAVHANLLAARRREPLMGTVLNVACGRQITVNELARHMAILLERPDLEAEHKDARAGDVKHSLADLASTNAQLHYQPIIDFDTGLAATIAWYQKVIKPLAPGGAA